MEELELEREPEWWSRHYRMQMDMPLDDLVKAFGHATLLRSCEVGPTLDECLEEWLQVARKLLERKGEIGRVREYLPIYFDPARKNSVYGPGAAFTSQATVERILGRPESAKPLRAIAAGSAG